MKEIALFLALALGLNTIQPCYPPSCSIDSNCADSIHPYLGTAKCCGGTCVRTGTLPVRVVGELCDSTVHETCFGSCASGSYCGPDKRCRALPGMGCGCSSAIPCVGGSVCSSANATMGTCVNATTATAGLGEPCSAAVTCLAGVCSNATSVCTYLNAGDRCSVDRQCGVDVPCRLNTSVIAYVCAPLCPVGTANCCSALADCNNARQCDTTTGTCLPYLGLDSPCNVSSQCTNWTTGAVICSGHCTSGGCTPTDQRCQLSRQIAVGQSCSDSAQCVLNSSCVNSVCTAFRSVAQGGVCRDHIDCVPPGICGSGPTPAFVCKTNGTTATGSPCLTSAECAPDAECTGNCTQKLSIGTNCSTGPGSQTCLNGTCLPLTYGSTSCYYLTTGCQCAASKSVPNGGNCSATVQCQSSDASCVSPGVCKPVLGRDCTTQNDCPTLAGFQYDCGCNRKCYLLNGPTPTSAPSPPTPGKCDAKLAAWVNATPPGTYGWVLYSASYLQAFGAALETFNASVQALGIDYACCASCPSPLVPRYSAYTTGGYQVDCSAKTIRKLPDTCDSTRAALGLLNCWPVSAAPSTSSLGLGVLVVLASLLF